VSGANKNKSENWYVFGDAIHFYRIGSHCVHTLSGFVHENRESVQENIVKNHRFNPRNQKMVVGGSLYRQYTNN